ncbi:MAG: 50S ribosomal protein L11 methyltransferase [Planctomycetes bacterium]|nr:50S ribosomal protein L11 methyltransferase [Planctomycetota bacterium]
MSIRYTERIYLISQEHEYELQEYFAAHEFCDFFIESFKDQSPVLKIYLPVDSDEHEYLTFLDSLELECTSKKETLEQDWLKAWLDTLEAFELSPGVWVNPFPEEKLEKPEAELIMNIVPGTAFGTGLHSTTRLAASLMEKQQLQGKSLLDVGCGTGILALLGHFRGAQNIVAVDDDTMAIVKAKETFKQNGAPNITAYASDLLKEVPAQKFDIVVANIICEVLLLLLADEKLKVIAPPGTPIIFSGISDKKKAQMDKALAEAGVELLNQGHEGDWNSYAFSFKN